MAAHGTPEYSTAAGNDYPAHEATYENFTFLILLGIVYVIEICLGLAIGGVKGNWIFEGAFLFIATCVAIFSLITRIMVPSYVILVLGFLGLAFA
jgi:hypothetical protein